MKGVILAGGKGTRLSPVTKIINKHLLPVGKYPMIYWPIFSLREAGIKDILIITNRESLSFFIQLLGEGEELGVHLQYKIQENANGIAGGIGLAQQFVNKEKFVVVLGDNIFEADLTSYIRSFAHQKTGAKVLLTKVSDPHRYGIAEINNEKQIITSIEEKPNRPRTNFCVTGIYMYDEHLFKFIEEISPSQRGELEVTDINNLYIKNQLLMYDILDGWWIDAGTHESLYRVNTLIYQKSEGE